MKQQQLSFWQMWNVSFGFLGVQMGFALQNANVSRILSDLGADLHSLSLFWLVAPIMGLIIQPLVGAASDRTWNRLGRRRPYILGGAFVATLAMAMMPNAPLFVSIIPPILFGAIMLALMDGSFNVAFQPFRSLVSDMVPATQRNQGYSIQSLLINIGAVMGSMLPFIFTNGIGLDNTAGVGEVAPSVIWAFYIGASVMLGSVLWTVFKTHEYPPEQYAAIKGISLESLNPAREKTSLVTKLANFFTLVKQMPETMRQLAVVQFFSWFAFFIMWVYMPSAVAQYVWHIDVKWFDSTYLSSLETIPPEIAQAKGAAGDWIGIISAAYFLFAALFSTVLSALADRFGRKPVYSFTLLAGGLGFMSFFFFNNPEIVHLNLGFVEVDVPQGAVGLFLPMLGIGIAWAGMIAMPYSILAGALPANKTGVYMGIFNFTVAAPQIVAGLFAGLMLKHLFDNQAVYTMAVCGASLVLGSIAVYFVKEVSSTHNPNDVVSGGH